MLASLEAKLIALGAVVLLLFGAYAFVHHQGAVSQQKADAAVIATKDQALSAASASLLAASHAIQTANAQALANEHSAIVAQGAARAAAASAQTAKQAIDQANSAWEAKFKAAQGAKGCETLQEQLCAAVFPY